MAAVWRRRHVIGQQRRESHSLLCETHSGPNKNYPPPPPVPVTAMLNMMCVKPVLIRTIALPPAPITRLCRHFRKKLITDQSISTACKQLYLFIFIWVSFYVLICKYSDPQCLFWALYNSVRTYAGVCCVVKQALLFRLHTPDPGPAAGKRQVPHTRSGIGCLFPRKWWVLSYCRSLYKNALFILLANGFHTEVKAT